MSALAYQIGWAMLKQAIKWLFGSSTLDIIRDGIEALLEDDRPGSEKHAIVVDTARKAAVSLSDLPKELFDIAVKTVYLEVIDDSE